MITPRFNLSQDDNTVSIIIRAPYCSLRELEAYVEDDLFLFTCKPYYLRLHLPGKLEDNDHAKKAFNADVGEFTFQYEKVTRGEHFPDLEFITKLLVPKLEVSEDGSRPIEVLESQSLDADDNDEEEQGGSSKNNMQYGFAMRGGYNFKLLSAEFVEVFEIDPVEVKFEKRQGLRQEREMKQFNELHYLLDLLDEEETEELIKLNAPWETLKKSEVQFTEKELDFLKDLPNIAYKLNQQQIKYCHYSLIDILYAYCYDCRITCFESTCESGWTISKISSSLCWFDSFSSCKQALVCAFRRSLIYPLRREFNLCQKVLKDLKNLIRLGEQYIIKCLMYIYDIFLASDGGHYVLNNLFIKDYIVYLMKWDRELWNQTVEELNDTVIEKKDLGLDLLKLEESIMSDDDDDLAPSMKKLNINKQNGTDSDDEETDSDDEETDSNDEETESSSSSSDESLEEGNE